jgi:FixJ family two-component response regulator
MTDSIPLVFVVDDDASVQRAIARLLRSAEFRAEMFGTADEFLARPVHDGPGCVILDVCLPGLNGLDVQHALAERHANLPIVFLTGHGDIPMTVRALKAGAVDFLTKPVHEVSLLAAVREALARQAQALRADSELAEIRRRAATLSRREQEVLALVVRGMLNKEVGRQLGVTVKTIKVHRARVMHKMQAESLAGLVLMADRLGVTEPAL